jgi:hypothetical protein
MAYGVLACAGDAPEPLSPSMAFVGPLVERVVPRSTVHAPSSTPDLAAMQHRLKLRAAPARGPPWRDPDAADRVHLLGCVAKSDVYAMGCSVGLVGAWPGHEAAMPLLWDQLWYLWLLFWDLDLVCEPLCDLVEASLTWGML